MRPAIVPLTVEQRRDLILAIARDREVAYEAGRASVGDNSQVAIYLADCSARQHRDVLRMIGSEED